MNPTFAFTAHPQHRRNTLIKNIDWASRTPSQTRCTRFPASVLLLLILSCGVVQHEEECRFEFISRTLTLTSADEKQRELTTCFCVNLRLSRHPPSVGSEDLSRSAKPGGATYPCICKYTTDWRFKNQVPRTLVSPSTLQIYNPSVAVPMPRFLNTYTGEFEWHDNPARVRYAILSHTWRSAADGGEQSLEDVKKLQSASFVPAQRHEVGSQSETLSDSPRLLRPTLDPTTSLLDHPHLSTKISQACLVARMNGFRLIWIDSCCIDKASSAELSEAINSMYELYRLSGACYVYLADVPDDDHPQALGSSFRFSRWHKRGWTLQELIAPERVIFLTSTWRFLGTRLSLATTLADITMISVDILVGRASVASISVAQRMSWASLRETTRVEDRAYSLLGIFGVHLSPIYGEGDNAFRRLQEEIIKTIPDQSIFAWGTSCTLHSLARGEVAGWIDPAPDPEVLAPSPWYFSRFLSSNVTSLSPAAFASRIGLAIGDVPPLHCVFTPQGVRVQLLCIDLTAIPQIFHVFARAMGRTSLCNDCARLGRAHMLALLQCEDSTGSLIALPLCRPPLRVGEHPGLAIATHIDCGRPLDHEPFRTVRLARTSLSEVLQHLLSKPAEVSLLSQQSRLSLTKSHVTIPKSIKLWPRFGTRSVLDVRFSPWCIEQLYALGLTISPLQSKDWIEEDEMMGQTTLSTCISFYTVEHGTWMARLAVINLHIVLHSLFSEHGDRSLQPDTAVCFTITHSLEMHRSEVVALGAAPPAQCTQKHRYRFSSLLPTNPLANVQSVLHFYRYSDSGLENKLVDARIFRASLELPFRSPQAGNSDVLWLHVEISENISSLPLPPGLGAHADRDDRERPTRPDSPNPEPGLDTTDLSWHAMTAFEDDTSTAYMGSSIAQGPLKGPGESSTHDAQDEGVHRDEASGDTAGGPQDDEPPSSSEPMVLSARHHVSGITKTPGSVILEAQPVSPETGSAHRGDVFRPPSSSYNSLEIIQRDNDALRAQTTDLAAQVAALTSQNAVLSSQIAEIFSRLKLSEQKTVRRAFNDAEDAISLPT
ncbi:hypothetical protein VTO73DRAFT_12160 [Trametes versicolor]